MYNDDEAKRTQPIKSFLMCLILIIIFVLLLVWLLPMPNLTGLNNKIFNANIQEMKDAAIPYFTTDKLPQKEGDSVKLTLQEMIDLKLLLPFTDKNGEACDTENSYILLTKKKEGEGYELKTYLKCKDEENYIITTLGCYAYCNSAVCEKEEEKKKDDDKKKPTPTPTVKGPSCTLVITKGTKGESGWYHSDVTVGFKSKSGGSYKITAYGIGTSTTFAGNTSFTVNKEGSTTVYGYVKNSNGKTAVCSIVVKKDTVKPNCNIAVLSGSKGSDGSYNSDVVVGLTSKTDATSGVKAFGVVESATPKYNGNPTLKITTNGTHKIYGYVKDTSGNVNSCNITIKRNAGDKPTSTPSCSLNVANGTLGNNGWYVSNVIVGFATKSTTGGAKITGFGLGTSENYNNNTTYTVSKDGSITVYGYVKDSYGNKAVCSKTIKRDATKPSCVLKVISGTYNSSGYYTSDIVIGFSSKSDATSGMNSFGIGKSTTYGGNTTYKITTVGKHTVYGYVKDNAGNTNTCSITVEKQNKLEYQYKKDIAAQYSAWSAWSTYTYSPSNPPKFGSYPLIEMVDLGKTSELDYYEYSVGDPIRQNVKVKVGTINQTYCSDYNYYRITTTTSTTTYAIKYGDDWKYVGRVTTTGTPTDTMAVKYEFVGLDWSGCGTGCTRAPRSIWNKYTRTVYTVPSTTTVQSSSGVKVTCAKTETKTVTIYSNVNKIVGYNQVRTPVYKDVYKYKKRTRTLVREAYTDYKWSYYNDQSLISQGYTMTGNTRVAN